MASRYFNRPTSSISPAAQSREKIISAALALIENEGLDAFSTRKLASCLGLKVMSLYHYFPSREALFDEAVNHMISEVPLPNIARVGWRQGLLRLARDYRTMGHRHLRAIPLLAQRCPASPTMQMFLDTLNGFLLKAGLSPKAAMEWLFIQRDYVVGSLMADHAAYLLANEPTALNSPAADDNVDHPQPNLGHRDRKRAFEKGFTAMLDAIERER